MALSGTIAAIGGVFVALKVALGQATDALGQISQTIKLLRSDPELAALASVIKALLQPLATLVISLPWYGWLAGIFIVSIAHWLRIRLYVTPRQRARLLYREQLEKRLPDPGECDGRGSGDDGKP